MKMQKILSTIAAVGLVASSNAAFAVPGNGNGSLSNPNASSAASKEIKIFVKSRVRITGFSDFEFSDWKIGDGDITHTDDVCIYANSAAGYNVAATSTNGAFNLSSADNTHNLPYALDWNDGAADEALAYGVTTTNNFTNASRVSANCGGGDNSALKLTILATDLQQAPGVDSAYIDTVTITVTPA